MKNNNKSVPVENSRPQGIRRNEQIRVPEILLIKDGQNLGIKKTRDALELARSFGLDLVEVSPHSKPPVCHITAYGKYLYDKNKNKKKPNVKKEKEVSFRYIIGEGDLNVKINQIKDFLTKDYKVKISCLFKNREKAHKDLGFDLIQKVLNSVGSEVHLEHPPKLEGDKVVCKIQNPTKKK